MNAHDHKALTSRHKAARSAADEARRQFASASDAMNRAEKELRDVGALVAAAQQTFTVSEHAIVRWFQRVQQLDPNAVIEVITAEIAPQVEQLGDGRYPLNRCAPGFVAIVKQKTVVTIEPAN